jgi:hypothetical protein
MSDKDKPSKDKKDKVKPDEAPVDLAARIGSREAPPPQRLDGPLPQRLDGPLPSRRASERPSLVGADEPAPPPLARVSGPSPEIKLEKEKSSAIMSPRGAPGPGEIDVVVTPLPTPDDWHRFEVELRRVRGVTQLRPEYYRHGVAKMRVSWQGSERLAQALRAGIPGYRIRIIGEDRGTIQILVSSNNDERRPG